MHVVSLIIVGLAVGLLGRLIHPGRDKMGILRTLVIGVASVLIAGLWIGGWLGFALAVLIGAALVALWSHMFERGHQRSWWHKPVRG
jgi:uncharacterized membrane protein YeaQ/YmgE (transglycosylase-associated protein family)